MKLCVYQVPIDTIEGLTDLDFGSLKNVEPVSVVEGIGGVEEKPTLSPVIITQPEDIMI